MSFTIFTPSKSSRNQFLPLGGVLKQKWPHSLIFGSIFSILEGRWKCPTIPHRSKVIRTYWFGWKFGIRLQLFLGFRRSFDPEMFFRVNATEVRIGRKSGVQRIGEPPNSLRSPDSAAVYTKFRSKQLNNFHVSRRVKFQLNDLRRSYRLNKLVGWSITRTGRRLPTAKCPAVPANYRLSCSSTNYRMSSRVWEQRLFI
jgi:hypothetical protein